MKRQLRCEFKDGSSVKITNNKAANMAIFIEWIKCHNINSIQNMGIYTYPLKENKPLILVQDGIADNKLNGDMFHER